jgi:hypothetical protein
MKTLRRLGMAVGAALIGPVLIFGTLGLLLQGFEFLMESESSLPLLKGLLLLVVIFLCGHWGWKQGGTPEKS